MAGKTILIVWKSEIRPVQVTIDAPRLLLRWLHACANMALAQRTNRFIMTHSGLWHVYGCAYVSFRTGYKALPPRVALLRSFPNEDAAAMWLLVKDKSNG